MPGTNVQHRMFYERNGIILTLRQYILSVMMATIICALIKQLTVNKGPIEKIMQLIVGLVLTLSILSPVVDLGIDKFSQIRTSFSDDAQAFADKGKVYAFDHLAKIIKERTEAYILDKAAQYDAQLEIEVTLSDDDMPIPVAVNIYGAISPYGKQCMMELISNDFGIGEEAQTWN